MIDYADYFTEIALKRAYALLMAHADPADELAFLMPQRIAYADRYKMAQLALGVGHTVTGINIRRGMSPATHEAWKPTLAVVQENGGADGRQPLGFGTKVVDDTDGNPRRLSVLPGAARVRIIILATGYDTVRVLSSFLNSAMMTMAVWLLGADGGGSGFSNLYWSGLSDIVPDPTMVPEGVATAVGASGTYTFEGMNVVPHIGAYTGTIAEFLSVAETGVSVDAEPDPDTKTYTSYGTTVQGQATPEE